MNQALGPLGPPGPQQGWGESLTSWLLAYARVRDKGTLRAGPFSMHGDDCCGSAGRGLTEQGEEETKRQRGLPEWAASFPVCLAAL